MVRILSLQQIKQVEETANENGITYLRLMENAGSACAKIIRNKFDDTGLKNAVIVCGKGKNGGDGFVIARKLFENGYKVNIILAMGEPEAENAVEMYHRARSLGINFEFYDENNDNQLARIVNADIVVDCVFGTGFRGSADRKIARLFDIISSSEGFVISVDLPSGMYTDSSELPETVVRADMTISVIALKYSLVYYPSAELAGEVKVVSIGIPEDIIEKHTAAYSLNSNDIKAKFIRREENSNKGDYGKALVIAGSYEMPGAALLSSESAVKSGVGLVKTAFPDKAYPVMMSTCPEKVLVPLPSNENGRISSLSLKRIGEELSKCDAVLIGCGLGNDSDILGVVQFVLENSTVPVILDADGINVLKGRIDIIKNAKAPVVITPHPGEAARMLNCSVEKIQADRIAAAEKLYEATNAVVVLKGSRTVVTKNAKRFYINMTGNSGLATAGSGDVLAGVLLSFLAQGMSPYIASVCAVYIHALAGDYAAEKLSKTGMSAHSFIDELPKLLLGFEEG
jgi:NAD(P)H-hydrate epimerase